MAVALDMSELVERSDRIAVVRVVAQQARWDARGRIVTDVMLEVDEALHGGMANGERFVLSRLGGSIGEVGMRIAGEPSFEDGARYLVFARVWEDRFRPVGMSQGVLPVQDDDNGAMVQPGGGGLALVRQNGRTPALGAIWRPRHLRSVVSEVQSLVREQ